MEIEKILSVSRMIPVLTVNKLDDAVPLCNALVEGGLTVIEITLRTKPALAAVERLAKVLSKICIGIRTLLDPLDLKVRRKCRCIFCCVSWFECGYSQTSCLRRLDLHATDTNRLRSHHRLSAWVAIPKKFSCKNSRRIL